MRPTLYALPLLLVLPAFAQAQHAGSSPVAGAHFAAAPAPMAAPRVASAHPSVAARPVGQPARVGTRLAPTPKTTTHPAGWNQGTRHNGGIRLNSGFHNGNRNNDCFPVPGLGFDYPHFFATHPNAGHCFNSGFAVPFIDGGFYIPTPYYGDQGAPPSAEETVAAEQAGQGEEPGPQEPAYEPARAKSEPVPAQQEYVFVKRDGSLIFAVAYSWINDRLQYVTSEGLRRTVPRSTLDLDATQQFNDQRGVSIQLHT